nr:UDP-glycosyltransferase [Paris polyphylla]
MGTKQSKEKMSAGKIIVVPFPHPGHIFPATELCRHLAARNYSITLFLPSTSSSSSSSSSLHPLITTVEFPVPHPTNFPPHLLEDTLPDLLARHIDPPPVCAIVDEMIGWLIDACASLNIPAVSFFTSSACSSAIQHATSSINPSDLLPGQPLLLPGLPDDLSLTASDLPPPDHGPGRRGGGPHRGPRVRGMASLAGAKAILVNTCDDLERPFVEYMARVAGKPVWGVGPLLPAQFWSSTASHVRDREVRSRRESSVSEGDVIRWLDSRPRGSVVYVSFGSLVVPSEEELGQLADGLRESGRPFIWAVQPDARRPGPDGPIAAGVSAAELARRTGSMGLVVEGWAPQLAILGHPSTGGFVCHCGWNSTVEALAFGMPMLTWPVRGDQYHNAKLVTNRLGTGWAVRGAGPVVGKGDVARGIEKVMGDEEIKRRAAAVGEMLSAGFPPSSSDSVDEFLDFVSNDARKN